MDTRIIKMYKDELKSMKKIGEELGITTYFVKKTLLANNIQLRTRAEQNDLTNQSRSKFVDDSYFSNIDSNKKAWILGFFAADGTIGKKRNSMKIGLSSKDREILERIKAEIQIEREILDYTTQNGFDVSSLTWSSNQQKEDLRELGITPGKTYKDMVVPNFEGDIDKQLSFLLGYFDGDGCFLNDGTYCRISICSYGSCILQDFSSLIEKKFGFQKRVLKEKHRENYHTLTYGTQEGTVILEYLYSINDFYLERKYQKYQTWKKENNK